MKPGTFAGCNRILSLTLPALLLLGCGTSSRHEGPKGNEGGAGSEPVDCSQYANEQAGTTVRMVVENALPEPVFVGPNCLGLPLFEVRDGATDSEYTLPRSCDFCNEDGCSLVCGPALIARIAPGEELEVIWDGLVTESVAFPSVCRDGGAPGDPPYSCSRSIQAPSGTYSVRVPAGTSADCRDDAACDCMPASDGLCWLNARRAGDMVVADAEIVLPEGGDVTVTFQ